MKKYRFGVDVDGVLGNFTAEYLVIANRICGTSYTEDDISQWDLEAVPEFAVNSKAIWSEVGQPGFAYRLPLYPGAVEGVKQLHELGEVFAVTSPVWMQDELHDPDGPLTGERKRGELHGQTFCYDRMKWLEQHFGISRKHIIFCYHKYTFDGDALIDDKLSNIEHWIDAHGSKRGTKAILWAQKYNVGGDAHHPKVLRTDDWNVALNYLKGGRKKRPATVTG